MNQSSSDNYKKMFNPEHPQRRLHILLSILAFVLVVGSITYYQIYRVKVPEQLAVPEIQDPNVLTQAKINKLAEVSQSLTIQKQTPQFKAKLSEVSKSLNKK